MNFSDEQNREHIKELQRLLYEISFYNSRIPAVIPDGIYSGYTREAIKVFQHEYGIPVTGNTDFDTWEKLAEINKKYYPAVLPPDIFKRGTVLVSGSSGAAVYMAQHMLNTIGRKYPNIPVVELTGVYDAPTERSVSVFRSVTRCGEDCEGINTALWNSMVAEFNKIVL